MKVFPGMGTEEDGRDKSLHVSLVHNPSHLEVVGCVAAGKTRAKIHGGSKAMCLQVSQSTRTLYDYFCHEAEVGPTIILVICIHWNT